MRHLLFLMKTRMEVLCMVVVRSRRRDFDFDFLAC